tara:strand:+ start:733 stop:1005 length:273 start_codon:yes stop_codon:yes gene_type:complete
MSIFFVGLFVVLGYVVFLVISKDDLGIISLNDKEEKESNVVPSKSIYSREIENNQESNKEESSPKVIPSEENEISLDEPTSTSVTKEIDD